MASVHVHVVSKPIQSAKSCTWMLVKGAFMLIAIPKHLFQLRNAIFTLEISTQKHLGTVETRLYIGEMFYCQCKLKCVYASSMYASTHAHKHPE